MNKVLDFIHSVWTHERRSLESPAANVLRSDAGLGLRGVLTPLTAPRSSSGRERAETMVVHGTVLPRTLTLPSMPLFVPDFSTPLPQLPPVQRSASLPVGLNRVTSASDLPLPASSEDPKPANPQRHRIISFYRMKRL